MEPYTIYVTANNLDSPNDKGNNRMIIAPTHQSEKPTAKAASSKINERTPDTTAFLMFFGELSLYALNNGP